MKPDGHLMIGFDRDVRLDWLDAIAGRLAAGDSPIVAKEVAWNLLEGVVAGTKPRGARDKTLTILARVWANPPAAAVSLRDGALKLLTQASAEERLAIHWAMVCAAYPFFLDVAGLVGKSLSLNGEVALSGLTRRLVEIWGDRSTLRRTARHVVRSMVQWGALQDTEKAGLYLAPQKKIVVSSAIGEILVEGLLVAAQRGMPLAKLVSHPAVFPFDFRTDLTALRGSERLRVHRQGDLTDFVEMETPRPAAPTLAVERRKSKKKVTPTKPARDGKTHKDSKASRQLSLLP